MQAPAQGLGQLMQQRPQGMAPAQPQQPQQPMPSPMKASPMAGIGSVEDRVAAYRGNPAPLQQRYAVSQDLLDLLALQKIKSEKDAAVRQMQMQMAEQQAAQGQEPMTVAQQREKEVMDMTKNELAQQRGATANQQVAQQQQAMQKLMGGIASAPGAAAAAQPKMMATGGIVAFAGDDPRVGSKVPNPNDIPEDAKEELERAQREGDRAAMLNTIKKLAAAGYDVATLIPRGLMGAFESGVTRPLRALGVPIPYLPESAYGGDRTSMTPMMDKLRREEETQQSTPPAVSDTYPDETARGAAAGLQPQAQGLGALGAAVGDFTTAAGTPAAAPALAKLRSPAQTGLPQENAFGQEVQQGIRGLLGQKPDVAAQTGREEAMKFLGMPEAERKARAAQRAEVEAMDKAMFDPERQRQQQLENFLLGAAGQGSIGRTLGAGGRSAVNFERSQADLQRKRLLERQKMLTDEFAIDRGTREKAYEGGEKRYGEAAADVRTGTQLGTSIRNVDRQLENAGLDRDSRERIAELQAQVQQEVARATRENTLEIRRQTLMSTITNNKAKAEALAAKAFDKRIDSIEQMRTMNPNGKLTPAQQTQLDSLNADKDAAVNAAGSQFDALLDRLVGTSTAGYIVKKKTEPKK